MTAKDILGCSPLETALPVSSASNWCLTTLFFSVPRHSFNLLIMDIQSAQHHLLNMLHFFQHMFLGLSVTSSLLKFSIFFLVLMFLIVGLFEETKGGGNREENDGD
jgi:hypothetical protein